MDPRGMTAFRPGVICPTGLIPASVALGAKISTLPIEGIWSEKIRGCSYRRGNTALPHRTMLYRTITSLEDSP